MATTGKLRSSGRMSKTAEPPPPKGIPPKVWDKMLEKGSVGDVDDLEGGDPTRLMPHLRKIHKLAKAQDKTTGYRKKVKQRFKELTESLEEVGSALGTGHKRITIPKSVVSEGQLKRQLGFIKSRISIPERGQVRVLSFRHPTKGYHVHDHGKNWVMHKDTHAPKGVIQGAKHVITEGAPALYYLARDKVKGAPKMVERLSMELPKEYKQRVKQLKKISPMKKVAGREQLKDQDAQAQSPGRVTPIGDQHKESSFEFAELGPNKGETGWDPPVIWKPKKLKYSTATAEDTDELEPGQMQKAGYKLQGHTEVGGLRIAIENRKGSVRKGKDGDGNEWRTKMKAPYGYIVGTKGADGEEVDAYVGPDKDAPKAHVVHQRDKETGAYDEDKVILGVKSKKEAKELFLQHYDSPKFLGPISVVTMDRLRELVAKKKKLVKISSVDERIAEIVRLSRCER